MSWPRGFEQVTSPPEPQWPSSGKWGSGCGETGHGCRPSLLQTPALGEVGGKGEQDLQGSLSCPQTLPISVEAITVPSGLQKLLTFATLAAPDPLARAVSKILPRPLSPTLPHPFGSPSPAPPAPGLSRGKSSSLHFHSTQNKIQRARSTGPVPPGRQPPPIPFHTHPSPSYAAPCTLASPLPSAAANLAFSTQTTLSEGSLISALAVIIPEFSPAFASFTTLCYYDFIGLCTSLSGTLHSLQVRNVFITQGSPRAWHTVGAQIATFT